MIGIDEVDVTNLQSRGWRELTAGIRWWSQGPHEPGLSAMDDPADLEDKLASMSLLVLRASIDVATSREALLDGIDWNAIADWLDGLGACEVTALAIFRCGDRFVLHVTELLSGRPVDYVTGLPVTRPRVIDLGTDQTWPDCLNMGVFVPTRLEFIGAGPELEPAA